MNSTAPKSNPVLAMTSGSLCVFGHLVQNDTGVEFYPERIGREHLPAGKVVPGKLVKQLAESKFIPGIKTEDDGFIPGQVVLTDRGEQFVPGQVIETSEGMKFVPGQIIETKSGPKFVPGQTMETPDGPRFVPGQIINTRAGPTFIPGQVISTDDDGEKFVPGQIVDTDDGPRLLRQSKSHETSIKREAIVSFFHVKKQHPSKELGPIGKVEVDGPCRNDLQSNFWHF